MKAMGYIAAIIIGYYFFFGGDNKRESYDKSYEAGWHDEKAPSRWASKEEKEGYQAGLDDEWTYSLGYDDGHEKRQPQYRRDALYMDGYKDGKADNEKGL